MKQLQFYKYATWGLLILNVSMIAFFFLTAPPRPSGGERAGKKAIDILRMDEDQNNSFLQYVQQHSNQVDNLDKQQLSLLKLYFKNLISSSNKVNSDSLLNKIQLFERQKIEFTYQHFLDVKSILKPDQQVHFEDFMEHAMDIILKVHNKPPRPQK